MPGASLSMRACFRHASTGVYLLRNLTGSVVATEYDISKRIMGNTTRERPSAETIACRGSVSSALVKDDADEIGGVLGPELLHDASAMHLDGARTDAEMAARLLAGGSRHDLCQHVLLAWSQRLAARKMIAEGLRCIGIGLSAALGLDRLAHAGHDFGGAKRLFDEVERAVSDRVDRHRDVALAGHDQDRRWIVLGVELLEDIEPGAARNMHVEND